MLKKGISSQEDGYRILGAVMILTAIDDHEWGMPEYAIIAGCPEPDKFLHGDLSLWIEAAEWDEGIVQRYVDGEATWQDVVRRCIPIRTTSGKFPWQMYQK